MSENKIETYAVKLDTEVKQELQELIKSDDKTGNEFIKLLIDTYKTNRLTNTVVDTKADLKELNILTTRIYNLYSNLIERNSISIEGIKADITEQLQNKDNIIVELKEQLEELEETSQHQEMQIDQLIVGNTVLHEESEGLREQNETYKKLIDKLEKDNKFLEKLKVENKTLSEEVRELETKVSNTINQNKELQNIVELKKVEVSNINKQLEDVNIKHKEELEQQQSKLDLQHQQEILQIKQDHQELIQGLQDKRIKDIEQLQDKYIKQIDKADKDKEQLQKQIEELQEQLNKANSKKSNTSKPDEK